MNLLNYLFPDWKLIKTFNERWGLGQGNWTQDLGETVCYEIYFSEKFNKYKLKCKGHKPKYHPMYPAVIEYLNNLTNEHTSNSKET